MPFLLPRRVYARRIAPVLIGVLAVPVLFATTTSSVAVSCASTVSLHRIKHQVLRDKVVIDTFRATVTTSGHSRSANVIRTTLPQGTSPKLIRQSFGLVKPISDQVRSQAPRALAAINGDFFAYYRVGHGNVLLPWSSSVTGTKLLRGFGNAHPVVGVDVSGHPYGGPLAVSGTVADGSVSYQVRGVNTESVVSDGATVYTRAWYPSSSTPRPAGATEWVVSHRQIAQIWTGHSNGSPVPAGSKVVAFGSGVAAQAANAKVGDPVSVRYTQVTSSGVKLREAVGIRQAMIKASFVTLDCRAFDAEARPRTSIGWTAKGRWMTLIVPGTGYDPTGYRIGGFDVPEEAAVASHLGFNEAFILDGGGSVTEWARHGRSWGRVDDSNSAWERYVPNGLAFVRP